MTGTVGEPARLTGSAHFHMKSPLINTRKQGHTPGKISVMFIYWHRISATQHKSKITYAMQMTIQIRSKNNLYMNRELLHLNLFDLIWMNEDKSRDERWSLYHSDYLQEINFCEY